MRVVPEEYQQLAEHLREQKDHLAVRQKTIAEKAGVSESYVSQVFKGRIKPSDDFLYKLEEALELRRGSLFLRLGRPQMDFVRSFLTARVPDAVLTETTDEEQRALTSYLRFLRLQTRIRAFSESTDH